MESLRFLLFAAFSSIAFFAFFLFLCLFAGKKNSFYLAIFTKFGGKALFASFVFCYSCDFCHSVSDESFFAKIAMKIGHLHEEVM